MIFSLEKQDSRSNKKSLFIRRTGLHSMPYDGLIDSTLLMRKTMRKQGVVNMRRLVWCLGFVAALLAGGPANAASFDCGKAKSKLEVLICSTPALNAADEAMGQAYQAANGSFPVKGFVRASQAIFLVDYRACANDKAKDKGAATCTGLAQRRTNELQELLTDKIYADGITAYTPEDAVLLVGERAGKAYLKIFGSWMPDAYRPKPFPDGFICNEEFPLVQSPGGLQLKDADWEIKISEMQIDAEFYSCSPRNGISGTFKRVR